MIIALLLIYTTFGKYNTFKVRIYYKDFWIDRIKYVETINLKLKNGHIWIWCRENYCQSSCTFKDKEWLYCIL